MRELIDDVLARVIKGVRPRTWRRSSIRACSARAGLSKEKVEEWREQTPDWTGLHEDLRSPATSYSRSAVPLVPGEGEERSVTCLSVRGPDGSVTSKDEQKALKEVAEPIARAIRNVIKRVAYRAAAGIAD